MAAKKHLTCSREEAAAFLACSLFNIDALLQQKKIRKTKPGRLVVQSLFDHLHKKQEKQAVNPKNDENKAKALSAGATLKDIQAREAALDLAEREGQLLNRDEVIAQGSTIAVQTRGALEELFARLPMKVVALDERAVSALLQDELRKTLHELSVGLIAAQGESTNG